MGILFILFQENSLKGDKILKSRNPVSCNCTLHHTTVLWATVLHCTGIAALYWKLAQKRDRWRARENAVMNLRAP
jgi:hypothetical protein